MNSAMVCRECSEGDKGSMLAADPLDYQSEFVCDKCGRILTGATVFVLCKELEEKLEDITIMDVDKLEELLVKYLQVNTTMHESFFRS